MRLIDAEKCPCHTTCKIQDMDCPDLGCHKYYKWLNTTKYDIDKVVHDIGMLTTPIQNVKECNCSDYIIDKAIDIVRKGCV